MARDPWQPEQYQRFARERSQPFYDLLALVQPRPGMGVLDLGCGTGELTRVAHERLAAASTLGIDGSRAMLEQAAPHAGGGLRFERAEIASFLAARPGPFDLVLSNAALHWVPEHEALFAALAGALAPAGQLAVQLPVNHEQPAHTAAVAVATETPFREALGGPPPARPVLTPEGYARRLFDLGFVEQQVRMQVYPHVLPDREAVVEWVKGSTLTWFGERLEPELYASFLERYRERLFAQLPDEKPYLFTFRRLFVWGLRASKAKHAS